MLYESVTILQLRHVSKAIQGLRRCNALKYLSRRSACDLITNSLNCRGRELEAVFGFKLPLN